MVAYYNEINPFAAQWLRNLISEGLIAPGDVDERSISDVSPRDLLGYAQCHFFAGIGGCSYALRLAGWPDDKPVWTGSCPCQPFSTAGKRKGFTDERHLWPDWFWLIRYWRPDVLFGEQVEGPTGRAWLDLVFSDLEGSSYACGAAVLPAAGVGAPHGRHRTYWVGNTPGKWGRGGCSLVGKVLSPRGSGEDTVDSSWPDGFGSKSCEGVFELHEKVNGLSSRVERLRGYGNAIVPQVAAAFITAYLENQNAQQPNRDHGVSDS